MATRADWMQGRWGLMVHWLAPGPPPEKPPYRGELDDAVDHFNLTRFLDDFAATGASWLIFTVGQNTGYYASPSALLDEWAGPGHGSRRDLVGEIAAGVQHLGKRFIAYLPCEVAGNESVHQAFGWTREVGTDQRAFQERYTRFVREWAVRWGKQVDGWWFDGCYPWAIFPNHTMDWPLWFDACREGNPDAALAFNDGSFCVGALEPVAPEQDYLSGEVEVLVDGKIHLGRGDGAAPYLPTGSRVGETRCLWHALVPIDCPWAHRAPPSGVFRKRFRPQPETQTGSMEPPVYPDEELFSFVDNCLRVGGAVTLNVGIFQEGHLGPQTIRQLQRLASTLR
jgi:hypothetical protein